MGIKNFLFGSKKTSKAAGNYPPNVRPDLMDTVENALIDILSMNFALMNVEAQQVPTTGSTGDLRSRGYLLGLTEATVQQFADLNPTQEEFVTALASAFAVTYGPCDWNWALDTIDSFQAGDADTVAGAKLAQRDVQSVYSGEPLTTPTGFWLLNNGDEDSIRYNLAGL